MSSEKIEQVHDEEGRGSTGAMEAIESERKPRLAPQTIMAIIVSCIESDWQSHMLIDSPCAFYTTLTSSPN